MADPTVQSFAFSGDDIGVGLLESITLGLYRQASDVLREYISNEIDNDPPPSSVHVEIDPAAKTTRIHGDGPGMTFEQFRDAVKIGISFKDPKVNVGFRGIGIWAGVAACNTLSVATKSDQDDLEYELLVNCEKLRTFFRAGPNRNVPLVDALNQCAGYVKRKSKKPHGTEVTLSGVTANYGDLLSEEKVREYLTTVCPVAFETGFDYAKDVDSYLKKHVSSYRRVKMFLGPDSVMGLHVPEGVRPPIRREILGRIGSSRKPVSLGFFWLAPPKRAKRIPEGYDSGLRMRVKNFTVVQRDTVRTHLAERIKKKTNLHHFDYWLGELHLTHPELKPNSDRNDLEASMAREALDDFVSDLFKNTMVPLTKAISELHNLKEDSETALETETNPTRSDYPEVEDAVIAKNRLEGQSSRLKSQRDFFAQHLRELSGSDGIDSLTSEWTGGVKAQVDRGIARLEATVRKYSGLIEVLKKHGGPGATRGGGMGETQLESDSLRSASPAEVEDADQDDEAESTIPVTQSSAAPTGRKSFARAAQEEAIRAASFESDAASLFRTALEELADSGRFESEEALREFVEAVIRRRQRQG